MDNFSSKTCGQCGKTLTGRSDKKFCDAYCRNMYNNQHKAEDEQYIQLVNTRFRKNRKILKALSPEGKATVRKEVLDQMGFDYRYFSGIFKGQLVYYLVYDYAFAPIHDDKGIEKVVIVKRQDYMDKPSFEMWRK